MRVVASPPFYKQCKAFVPATDTIREEREKRVMPELYNFLDDGRVLMSGEVDNRQLELWESLKGEQRVVMRLRHYLLPFFPPSSLSLRTSWQGSHFLPSFSSRGGEEEGRGQLTSIPTLGGELSKRGHFQTLSLDWTVSTRFDNRALDKWDPIEDKGCKIIVKVVALPREHPLNLQEGPQGKD